MELETDSMVTIEEGRAMDMISGGRFFHLLISRAEIHHSWTSEVGTSILRPSRDREGPPMDYREWRAGTSLDYRGRETPHELQRQGGSSYW